MMRDDTTGVSIRQAQSRDEAALLDICLHTSNSGGDGRHLYSDPDYPGLIWALPYLKLCPEHAFVMEMENRVVGYCVAAPDTELFEHRLEHHWWPQLREMIFAKRPSTSADDGIFSYIRRPERTPDWITVLYPAHLHINLLPVAQGHGNGGRLLEHQLHNLSAAGVKGVHLGVNQHNTRVMPFYERHGFKELARLPSVIMGRKF